MIQRIQSLYLLGVALFAMLCLFANPKYATFQTGEKETLKSAELRYTTTASKTGTAETVIPKWINILILGFTGIGALAAIFSYKRKETQKKLCIYLTLLEALMILVMVLDFNTIKNQFTGSDTYPGIWSVFPVVMIVLSFMAWRGVRKDEELLRSMDRIR